MNAASHVLRAMFLIRFITLDLFRMSPLELLKSKMGSPPSPGVFLWSAGSCLKAFDLRSRRHRRSVEEDFRPLTLCWGYEIILAAGCDVQAP